MDLYWTCIGLATEEVRLFSADRIVAAQLFEEFGMLFQRFAVAARVVHLQVCFRRVTCRDGGILRRGRDDVVVCFYMEEAAECIERHTCGIGFPVGRVAGNVWGSEEHLI